MVKNNIKNLIKSLVFPLTILIILLILSYIGKYLQFPSPEIFISKIVDKTGELKIWIVFFIALVEGFLFLGQYFPGGFIIFFSIISSKGDIFRISLLTITISIAFIIAYSLNYVVGRYGFHTILRKIGFAKALKISEQRMRKKAHLAIAISYEDPNLASITATAAGIIHLPFIKFLILSSIWVLIWNIIWVTIIYILGETALKLIGINYIYLILGIWIFTIIIKFFISKKHNL